MRFMMNDWTWVISLLSSFYQLAVEGSFVEIHVESRYVSITSGGIKEEFRFNLSSIQVRIVIHIHTNL